MMFFDTTMGAMFDTIDAMFDTPTMDAMFDFVHKDVSLFTIFMNLILYLTILIFMRAKGLPSVFLALLFLVGIVYFVYMIVCNLLVLTDEVEYVKESLDYPPSPQWVVDQILREGQVLRGEWTLPSEPMPMPKPKPLPVLKWEIESVPEPEQEAETTDIKGLNTDAKDKKPGETEAVLEAQTKDATNKLLAITEPIRRDGDLADAIQDANRLSRRDEPTENASSPANDDSAEEDLSVALVLYQSPRNVVDIAINIPSKDANVEQIAPTETPIQEENTVTESPVEESTSATESPIEEQTTVPETPVVEENPDDVMVDMPECAKLQPKSRMSKSEIVEIEMSDAPKPEILEIEMSDAPKPEILDIEMPDAPKPRKLRTAASRRWILRRRALLTPSARALKRKDLVTGLKNDNSYINKRKSRKLSGELAHFVPLSFDHKDHHGDIILPDVASGAQIEQDDVEMSSSHAQFEQEDIEMTYSRFQIEQEDVEMSDSDDSVSTDNSSEYGSDSSFSSIVDDSSDEEEVKQDANIDVFLWPRMGR